ncbi:endophilin-B2-like isoform X3 [Xiphias gladius]|uniref:endophilin-B2-like isoform X3 n=1 Tax=Xiphias gladius TaxID=8245 RepID=UPI001A980603|nr:endophilin-B2-like isoform X3 [Xiphias gladius]
MVTFERLEPENYGARIEEFLYEKLERKAPSRITNGELLGQYMQDAAKEFGPGTPYVRYRWPSRLCCTPRRWVHESRALHVGGKWTKWNFGFRACGSTLIKVGECERRLGAAEREFLQTSAISFLTPLRNFLEGDWKTISKERRLLENLRLDLDVCKTRLKKAKLAEAKAAMAPDFQESRPRNYVLSVSASTLWIEEVEKAEHELRVAQTEFDRQAEITRLLLEGISSTHVNHLRCVHEFVEAQAAYYKQCHLHMQELQKELGRLPNAFALNSTHSMAAAGSAAKGISSPVETETLKIEEVQAPATGTRKAKVLYDYDAADSSELSLLADELITVYTVPGMDSDWLIGERGNQKGKVPVTYLELLS